MKVLITGFEPYSTYKESPSEKLIKSLERTKISNVDLVGRVLPVSFRRVNRKLNSLLHTIKPDYLIMFGYYPKATCFEIEKVAINRIDTYQNGKSALTDNDGVSLRRKIGNGPDHYNTTFPIHKLTEAFDVYKVPYKESSWPGTYVCNYSLYNILREIDRTGLKTKVAFIHIPSFRKILTHFDGSKKRVSIGQIVKSLRHVFSSF